jgi:hypothetical protein
MKYALSYHVSKPSATKRAALVLCIPEVVGSYLGPDIAYPE